MTESLKRCRECKEDKPLSAFPKHKAYPDGRETICSKCKYKSRKNRKPLPKPPVGYKRCTKCKQEKPATIEYFNHDKGRKDGFKPWCKSCCNVSNSKRRQVSPDKARKACREWRKRNPYWQKQYGDEHREQLRENRRAWRKKQRESNSEIYNRVNALLTRRRKARKRSLPDTFTIEQWERCLQYWNYCCAYCGRSAGSSLTISMEHFIALSDPACPGTTVDNMLCACHGVGGCNGSKNRRPASEWLIEKYGKQAAVEITNRIHTYFRWASDAGGAARGKQDPSQ